jgi:pimeloyl-ACP methyl ester carboxylesterase
MNDRRLLTYPALLLLLCAAIPDSLASRPDETEESKELASIWYGVMDAGGREFRFVVETTTGESGGLIHTLISLDEGSARFVLDRFVVDDNSLEFDLKSTDATYRGERVEDTVSGTWQQRGAELTLNFTRLPAPPADQPTEVWEGEINTVIQKLKVQLRVYKSEDDSEAVRFDSLTQKAGGFIATRTMADEQITVRVPALGGTFTGTLDPGQKVASGTWQQGGVSLKMTLNRLQQPIVGVAETLNRPQTPEPPFPYDVQEVTVLNTEADVTLAGTLTIPVGEGPFPAAILVSGSGPQDRNETIAEHKPFWVLADYLTRQGIAVLRYDDRGVGESDGDFQAANTLDFASDARAVLRFLQQHSRINSGAIGVIGHSEGGLIAPLVAAEIPETAFIVLLAGPGVNGREILLSQGELVLKAEGVTGQTELRAQRLLQTAMMDAVTSPQAPRDPAEIEKRVMTKLAASLPAEAMQDEALQQTVKAGLATLTTAWVRFFLAHEPAPVLRRVKCPVLALNGEKDVQVDPKLNLPAIRTALRTGGSTDFKLVELPSLNHLFQKCSTGAVSEYADIEQTMEPEVLKLIADWILARVKS